VEEKTCRYGKRNQMYNLYCSPDIIRIIKTRNMGLVGLVALMRRRVIYEGKARRKEPRHRWVDIINMDLTEIK
jgi:hypothetical protein